MSAQPTDAARERSADLAAMLALWRASRDERVAQLAERAAGQCAHEVEPLPDRPIAKHHEAWLARAAAGHPEDLGLLLQTLAAHKAPMGLERLQLLEKLEPNPLLASALTALVVDPPFQSTSGSRFWRLVFELLPRHADPRTPAKLAPLAGTFAKRLGAATIGDLFNRGVASALAATELALASDRQPLDPEQLAELARLEGRLGAPASTPAKADPGQETTDQFLARIWENPEDDALRQVYADRLNEAGDPRGELIALQYARRERGLSAAEQRRESGLLKKNLAPWLGDVGACVVKGEVVFERGFLHAARFHAKKRADWERSVGSPFWATVEQLEGPVPAELVAHPVMRALRRLLPDRNLRTYFSAGCALAPDALLALAERATPSRVESAALSSAKDERLKPTIERLAKTEAPGLPRLEELTVLGLHDWRWLWASPLGRRLRRVTLPSASGTNSEWTTVLPALLEMLRAAGGGPESVMLPVAVFDVELLRDGAKRTAPVSKNSAPAWGKSDEALAEASLACVPVALLERVELVEGPGFDAKKILAVLEKTPGRRVTIGSKS